MKALLYLPLLSCLLMGCKSAEHPPGIDANLGWFSQYNFRGAPQNDDGVFQADMTVSLPTNDGGTLGFTTWGNMDISNDTGEAVLPDGNGGKFSEIDLTAFYSGTVGGRGYSIGVISYNFPNGVGGATSEIYASLEGDPFGIDSSLTVFYDFDAVEGVYVNGAMSRAYGLNSKLSAELRASIGFSDEDHSAAYYGVSESGLADLAGAASLAYAYDENTTLSFTVSASTLIDGGLEDALEASGIDSDNVWAGFGVSWSF